MKGTEIHHRTDTDGNRRQFAIWQARLRDEMYHADGTANPLLWWCEDITDNDNHDWLCAGVKTKRECLEAIDEALAEPVG